ncbi:hypothetical protein Tco_0640658 [Tanacetum coccineum]
MFSSKRKNFSSKRKNVFVEEKECVLRRERCFRRREEELLSKRKGEHMALPPREQRHRFLRYEGMEYLDMDIVNFQGRLARIHRREVHRVSIFDFGGLSDLMAEGLSGRMLIEHRDEAGFVARLVEHFGLLTAEIIRGLMVIALELPIIDMTELPVATVGAPVVAEDALIIDEGDQVDPAPKQAPRQSPPPPPAHARTMPQRMARLEEEVHEIR